MSKGLLSIESWKAAFTPAYRAFVYTMIIYVFLVLVIVLPNYLLRLAGINLDWLASLLLAIGFVFAIFLAFFKVLDEDRPGQIQLM